MNGVDHNNEPLATEPALKTETNNAPSRGDRYIADVCWLPSTVKRSEVLVPWATERPTPYQGRMHTRRADAQTHSPSKQPRRGASQKGLHSDTFPRVQSLFRTAGR